MTWCFLHVPRRQHFVSEIKTGQTVLLCCSCVLWLLYYVFGTVRCRYEMWCTYSFYMVFHGAAATRLHSTCASHSKYSLKFTAALQLRVARRCRWSMLGVELMRCFTTRQLIQATTAMTKHTNTHTHNRQHSIERMEGSRRQRLLLHNNATDWGKQIVTKERVWWPTYRPRLVIELHWDCVKWKGMLTACWFYGI